jgi:nucleoside-diphosphate-sugar epimerase
MRVFVTGATGVIGRRVVPRLLEAGHRVTAVARGADKQAALARIGATAIEVDLFAPAPLSALLAGHDAAINLATHMPRSSARTLLPGAWRQNDRLRSEAAPALAQAALQAGVERFVQESFAPVYPDRGSAWIDETTPLAPAHYNRTVLNAERAVEHFRERGGVGVVLRFAFFYGADSRFLRELAGLARHGIVPLFGASGAFVSSVSHDDAANAVLAALDVESGAYNVADDEPLTHRAFADALAGALGVAAPRLPPAWLTPLGGSPGRTLARSLRISNAKLRATGWAPKYRSAREGLSAIASELRVGDAAHAVGEHAR